MYQGQFPPLGRLGVVEPPPIRFVHGAAHRPPGVRGGPVADEREAVVELYDSFDPSFRPPGVGPRWR